MSDSPAVVESARRLSQSQIWSLQRRFFEMHGMQAWSDGIVPHYITSNPHIAGVFGRVLFGWLRDQARAGHIDRSAPLYLVELGGGCGRFTFHFLKRFIPLLERSVLRDIRFKYVFTDFTATNVELVRRHRKLRPFVDAGRLDFACFDAGNDQEIALLETGVVVREGQVNPLAVIANYVFDGIPQDVFRVEDGVLHERLATLTGSTGAIELGDPATIKVGFTSVPAAAQPYGDPEFDRILEDYRSQLKDTTVLFPSMAMRCLRSLRRLGGDRLLVIAADKGHYHEDLLAGRGDPVVAIHGSISLSVNFHALGRYCEHAGGQAFFPSGVYRSLPVAALLFGAIGDGYLDTRQAFAEAIDGLGPGEFFELKKALETIYRSLTLEQVLALLRASGMDSRILDGCLPTILASLDRDVDVLRTDLVAALRAAWDLYFPIGESEDIAAQIALVFQKLGRDDDAVALLEESLRLNGPAPATYLYLARSQERQEHFAAALDSLDRALAIQPDHVDVRTLRAKVVREVAARAR